MSGLRETLAEAIGRTNRPSLGEGARTVETESWLWAADAVLRVLAEHGDTQQVREQVYQALRMGVRLSLGDLPAATDAVMAVVAPIVAARDELIEQYKTLRKAYVEVSADEEYIATRAKEFIDRAERAEADLAAAQAEVKRLATDLDGAKAWRHRAADWEATAGRHEADLAAARELLDKVRDLANEPDAEFGVILDMRAILDAPARPAGHDETGQ